MLSILDLGYGCLRLYYHGTQYLRLQKGNDTQIKELKYSHVIERREPFTVRILCTSRHSSAFRTCSFNCHGNCTHYQDCGVNFILPCSVLNRVCSRKEAAEITERKVTFVFDCISQHFTKLEFCDFVWQIVVIVAAAAAATAFSSRRNEKHSFLEMSYIKVMQ